MTRHLIDDYGHTTQTAPLTDEWAVEHLPLTTVALAAAVPVIEAELRARIAGEIEADGRHQIFEYRYAAAIARGTK